jgi:orsellinic acid C2-O-methyltransferase
MTDVLNRAWHRLVELSAGHPRDQADFDEAMAAGSIERARAVLATCSFDGLETIVDVGGGTGRFLAELLAAVPHIRGVLADRAEVVAGAGEVLAETVWPIAAMWCR